MKNITDYLRVFKNIETYKDPEPRNMYSDGQLVTPSADGSRPGYQGNPNRTYPYTLETGEKDRRLGFDTEKQKHFKKVGKATKGNPQRIIYQEVGESLEDFKLRKTERMTTAVDKTVEARNYIDNWTKNWLDQNLSKYGVKDFEVMLDELSTAWQNEVATGNVPKGKGIFNLTTSELKLPNITTGHDLKLKPDLTPFKYEGFDFYKNLETKGQIDRTMGQWRKMFYKNKIRTTPDLQENLKNFYKFMAGDKRGVYNQPSGLTIKEYYNTQVSDDAKFLLDKDASGLDKNPKKELFNSFDDIKDNYNKYTQDKQKLVRIERLSEAAKKAGPDTAGQAKLVSDRILSQNKIVAEMTPQQLVKDKKFIKSLRTVINPTTGDLSFTGYTKEDPKVKFGKKVIRNDLELAKHAIERAKNGNLIHAEHISPVASGKLNIGFPNNLQSANYITNAQIDNARRYLKNNPDTPNAKILENNFLKENNLRISGQEYVRPFGVDAPIFDSKTGTSDIVERTFIGNTQETPIKSFEEAVTNSKRGGALLTHNTLSKGNFKPKCKTKFANGGGGLCGKAFAEKYPQEYLDEVMKDLKATKYLQSKEGLTAAKSFLSKAPKVGYWANPLTLGGGEAWYSTLAGINEYSKGASLGEAVNEGLWFIPGKHSRDLNILLGQKTKGKEGRNLPVIPNEIRSQFDMLTQLGDLINKEGKLSGQLRLQQMETGRLEDVKAQRLWEERFDPKKAAEDAQRYGYEDILGDIQWSKDIITPQIEKRLADVGVEGEDIVQKWRAADPTGESYSALQDRIKNFIVDKYNRGKGWERADPFSGSVWNAVKRGWQGPQHLLGFQLRDEPGLWEKQKELDYQKLTGQLEDQPITKENIPPELIQNFLSKFPEYSYIFEGASGGRAGYMGGGIAAIRKPHAIPPERQGLRSIMINVNDD